MPFRAENYFILKKRTAADIAKMGQGNKIKKSNERKKIEKSKKRKKSTLQTQTSHFNFIEL